MNWGRAKGGGANGPLATFTTESRLQTVENMIWQLYGSISKFYLVRIQSRSPHGPWKLELAKDLRSNTRALYPQQFDPWVAETAR